MPALPPNIGVAIIIITTTNSSSMVLSSILVRSLMHLAIPMMTASKRMSHVSATAAHCSLKGIFAFPFQTVGTESATSLVQRRSRRRKTVLPDIPPRIAFELPRAMQLSLRRSAFSSLVVASHTATSRSPRHPVVQVDLEVARQTCRLDTDFRKHALSAISKPILYQMCSACIDQRPA
ncbi:hypothetical protein FHL15_002788 [Xylaria flabelliformis]|uniref:Uncharacterized protein n=1 Tax=Xylaria flabelliformis TaxID=2512241 RepID=A0A553I8I7_9PEZI|nr:hypothetical protein FHL15_002788 [Xylaria flabelliformis]